MNFQELAEYISTREGKREQVNIAQISEILSIVSACFRQQPESVLTAFGYSQDTIDDECSYFTLKEGIGRNKELTVYTDHEKS